MEINDDESERILQRVAYTDDLVAADAVYHHKCHRKFYLKTSKIHEKPGRPPSLAIDAAMNEIYKFLENNDECQFSLSQLLNEITGFVYDVNLNQGKLSTYFRVKDFVPCSTTRARTYSQQFWSMKKEFLDQHLLNLCLTTQISTWQW